MVAETARRDAALEGWIFIVRDRRPCIREPFENIKTTAFTNYCKIFKHSRRSTKTTCTKMHKSIAFIRSHLKKGSCRKTKILK